MINKKINKALAFLITSFAFFAFSTSVYAEGNVDVKCTVGKEITIYCQGNLKQISGESNSHYVKSEQTAVSEQIIKCDNGGTSQYLCEFDNSDLNYTYSVNINSQIYDLGTDSARVDMIKQNKRTNDTGVGDSSSIKTNKGNVTVVNKGTNVFGKSMSLDGGVCKSYTICKDKVFEKDQYIVNANVMYNATAGSECETAGSTYTAFCLEAQFYGPAEENGDCLNYKASQIDPTSLYQVSLFELYKLSGGRNLNSNPQEYFTYEAAARLLAYEDEKYQTRSNTGNGSMNNHSVPYRSGIAGAAGVGNVGSAAGQLASQALANAKASMAAEGGVASGTLGVRITQLGGYTPVGGSYQSAFTVTVQNVTSATQIGFGNLSFSLNGGGITVSQQGDAVYDPAAKTMAFTVLIGGIPGKDSGCTDSSLKVTLSYDSGADLRSAFILDAVSTTTKANRQRFAVFAPSNGKVSYELPLSNCNNPGGDSCQPYAALFCNESDKNGVITVNEGAPSEGAETDWEGCIIGKTDSQGNSYDVVNNSDFKQTEDTGDASDDIKGYTSDGKPIKDAAFCTVSCKEQYQFVLPGYKEQVKQGTYFSFHADGNMSTHLVVGLNAERKCVSGNIENETYNNRAKDIRAQQVDYLNAYLYYYQIYQALLSDSAATRYNEGIHKWYTVEGKRNRDECDTMDGRSVEELISVRDHWEDKQYIDAWDYDGVSLTLTLYELVNPSSVEGGELRKVHYTLSNSDLKKAYKDVVKTPEIKKTGLSSKGYNFYSTELSDYDVFSEGISGVAVYGQTHTASERYWYNDDDYDVIEHDPEYVDPPGVEPFWTDGWTEHKCKNQARHLELSVSIFAEVHKESEEWKKSNIDILANEYNQFDNYRAVLEQIAGKMELAKQKYDALIEEIAVQNAAIQECTNYLAYFTAETNPYNFDPVITFSYPDQGAYMAMLAPNVLENVNPTAPTAEYSTYFCASDPGSAEAVFSCHDEASEQNEFKYLYQFEIGVPGEQIGSSSEAGKKSEEALNPNDKLDTVKYYNAARVGSRAFYGRTDGFEWYQSATQFYTIAPDGIVTTNKNAQNATIIDTDGRVYPVAINTPEGTYPFYVTFSNIGQFNESGALGRIMGGGDGKAGTMSGETYDQQVCYYQVCRIDDPYCYGQYCMYNGEKVSLDTCIAGGKSYEDCAKEYCPSTNACVEVTRSAVCNYGKIASSYDFSDKQFYDCLKALQQADCCNEFQAYISKRQDGLYSNSVPEDFTSWYGKECDTKEMCESFTIISQESYFTSTSTLTDSSLINNNGALQLNARTISNYNLFPNESKGLNWQTPEAEEVIGKIESIGDGIFAEAPEYKIVLDNKCANAIKEYNARQSGSGDGYSNGGFNDYTNDVFGTQTAGVDKQELGDLENKTYGSQVKMSSEFYQLLLNNCKFEGTKAKDEYLDGLNNSKIGDGSRVLS